MSKKAVSRPIDICLVLEGTYPFVPGGVSSWVHHLVSSLPELTFSILHISPAVGFYDGYAYEMPANIVGVQEVYLHEGFKWSRAFRKRAPKRDVRTFCNFLDCMREGDTSTFVDLVHGFQQEGLDREVVGALLLNRDNWQLLTRAFEQEAPEESFLNYFWNWYYAHQPLVNVLTAATPAAGMFHTISTGYAGALAAAAAIHHDVPMILTEHGIYTKERRIEIHSAEWITDRPGCDIVVEREAPYFRRFWNRQFQMMSKICYDHADEIFTLYTGNATEQIKDGADPAKIRIIPNGIDISRFAEGWRARCERESNDRFTVGFVGRVCPIKDVRTFIAAMRLVKETVPDVLVRILGPMAEDPDYAEGCQSFATALDLDDNVRFEGRVAVDEEMPSLDVLVLTSISEAQPLVILEGGAVGVPAVATDVGSCRELLEGREPADRAIGTGGLLTPIASPGETARAVLQLWADPTLREQMGRSLRERVLAYYDQCDMVDRYRDVYYAQLGRDAAAHCEAR